MEERKWENLEVDCLVNILGRVGIESLLLDIPFVCKSWHEASLNPLCWQRLVFPFAFHDSWFDDRFTSRFRNVYGIHQLNRDGFVKFNYDAFVKFIIDRSCRNATVLVLPSYSSKEVLKYAADECPALQVLGLPKELCYEPSLTAQELIGKWKILEGLILGSSLNLTKFLVPINLNCKNFEGLRVNRAYIGEEEASAIVTLLPNIKHLYLKGASIDRENLVTILQGCKELVHLDVSNCIVFEADDKILEIASHISMFKFEGSRAFDDDDDDWDWNLSSRDADWDGYNSD